MEFSAVQYAGVTLIVLAALLGLSVATYRRSDPTPALPPVEVEADRFARPGEFSPGVLLANVALTHGLFGGILAVGAVATGVPAAALGVAIAPATLPWNIGLGVGLGVVLYAGNETAMRLLDAAGVEYESELRETLTPDSARGWVALLGVVLPVVAGFEELLFRASLIGVMAAGFGVPLAVLAVLSSVAFAVGHGLQGPGGIAVAGLLGLALAAAFVVTGSLVVVVVAHYAINALEFLVNAR